MITTIFCNRSYGTVVSLSLKVSYCTALAGLLVILRDQQMPTWWEEASRGTQALQSQDEATSDYEKKKKFVNLLYLEFPFQEMTLKTKLKPCTHEVKKMTTAESPKLPIQYTLCPCGDMKSRVYIGVFFIYRFHALLPTAGLFFF